LAIGRLSHYKGFAVLLEALAGLPEASLLIIGEGEERAALQAAIGQLGLDGRVFLAGTVSDGERELCLDLADLLCLPSLDRTEAFGLAILEAMRAGKAVLASSVPGSGMAYTVDEGRTGLLATPGDAESVGRNIGRLLADGPLRQAFAQAGRERFLQMFTLTRVAALMEELYAEILRPSGEGGE
jgi:glycosyltransferase involved in cell wall biosynthesis